MQLKKEKDLGAQEDPTVINKALSKNHIQTKTQIQDLKNTNENYEIRYLLSKVNDILLAKE